MIMVRKLYAKRCLTGEGCPEDKIRGEQRGVKQKSRAAKVAHLDRIVLSACVCNQVHGNASERVRGRFLPVSNPVTDLGQRVVDDLSVQNLLVSQTSCSAAKLFQEQKEVQLVSRFCPSMGSKFYGHCRAGPHDCSTCTWA